MITKFEATGIALSVVLMAIALFFLNLDQASDVVAVLPEPDTQAASVIVVNDGEAQDQQQLAGALAASFNGTDTMQKVVIDDVKLGGGEEAVAGKTVRVHYVGRLENGQEFDNSKKRGVPFEFTLGEGMVIAGWEEGLLGMREGGERTLVIPPQFGYGSQAIGPIPANATLLFAIELVEVI
jgi:FKBP-type peptidyl-prolyl cis-trans isomerase